MRYAPTAFAVGAALMLATPVFAQQATVLPAGKMLTYDTKDSDTGEHLQTAKMWQAAGDDGHPALWSEMTFPNGDRSLNECIQGKGSGKPATVYRSVLLNSAGKLDASDFETLDP